MARRDHTLYYVSLYNGHCGIIGAVNLESARQEARWSSGSDNVRSVRPATQGDIDWVKAMGGRVPKGRVSPHTE